MATVNEELADEAVRHAVYFDRYSRGVSRRLIALLNRVDAQLAAELQRALADVTASDFRLERLESLLASVRQINASLYQQLGLELTAELRQAVEYEVGYQLALFDDVLPEQVRPMFNAVTVEQAYAAAMARPFQGALLRDALAEMGEDKARRIRRAIADGYTQGKTTADIVRSIRGTRALQYRDGIIEMDRRNLESITITALQSTAATARDQLYEANADLIKALVWTSTLDLRTTASCFPASTLALPVGDLRGVTRRHWDGYLVVVTTASGKKLRATPNHPVLTARGWRPIQEIQPGKDVLQVLASDVGCVESAKNIEMPASIGAIFDALNEPAFCGIATERSSEIDFHGDGMCGDYEVNYPRAKGDLRLALDAAFGKQIAEKLLVFIGVPGSLPSERLPKKLVMGSAFIDMTAQIGSGSVEDGIEAGSAYAHHAANIDGLGAANEHLDDLGFVRSALGVSAPQSRHDAGTFEDAGNGGRGDVKVASDGGGGLAVRIAADDVIAVEREFFSGHVYNLSTSTAFYIADGFVVHNCRIRDGKRYTIDGKPVGHSIPWGAGPGRLHWRCRSVGVPVTKSWRELGIDIDEMAPGTRSSMDGQVPAEQTYAQWLTKQSASRQDDVLGPTRGKLLRDGGLSVEEMYSARGTFLTLDELRARDAEAFRKAGV